MKRVLWLVPPRESWLATGCWPHLAAGLGAEGFDVACPTPPPVDIGPIRLGAHYWKCLQTPCDLIHSFDFFAAMLARGVSGRRGRVCLDKGLAINGQANSRWIGMPTVSWGEGGLIPWPPASEEATTGAQPHGSFVGLDASVWLPNLMESVVWSLEIARQVVPQVQLAPGRMVAYQPLQQFAHAVGAQGALTGVTCEQALQEGSLNGLLLARPDRRVLELAIRALSRGVRVVWLTDQTSKKKGHLPASDPPLVWRDRTGLARLLLSWGRTRSKSASQVAPTGTLLETTRAIAQFYRGVMC